jgi:hypothetical protein
VRFYQAVIPPPTGVAGGILGADDRGVDQDRRREPDAGQELYISDTTVKTHITHILQKLNLRDRVQAVVLAYQTGLFEADARPSGNRDERPTG